MLPAPAMPDRLALKADFLCPGRQEATALLSRTGWTEAESPRTMLDVLSMLMVDLDWDVVSWEESSSALTVRMGDPGGVTRAGFRTFRACPVLAD
jgi:hypothetical protein